MRIVCVLARASTTSRTIFRNRSTNQANVRTNRAEKTTGLTVDINDVERHSKLSTTWWDKNGEMTALHAFNPLRVQFIRDGLANAGFKESDSCFPLQGLKILDVGCGGGILVEPLARIGAQVIGIDASSELIATAKEHATLDSDLAGRINYICTTVEKHAETEQHAYDAVIASEILEHVANKEIFLKCCANTLKLGGSLFVTTMNKTLPSWFGGIIVAEHLLKIVPTGTHNWNKFISPNETQRLLEASGCKTKLIHGIFYNPLTKYWSWTTSTAINYAIHAIKQEEH